MPRRAAFDRAVLFSSATNLSASRPVSPTIHCTLLPAEYSGSHQMPSFLPPLFEQGRSDEFARSAKTLALVASPRDDSVAVFAAANVRAAAYVTGSAAEHLRRQMHGPRSRHLLSATSTSLDLTMPRPLNAVSYASPLTRTPLCAHYILSLLQTRPSSSPRCKSSGVTHRLDR